MLRVILLGIFGLLISMGSVAAQPMQWKYMQKADKLTDEPQHFAYLATSPNKILSVGCSDSFVFVMVQMRAIDYEPGSNREVVWRIDNAPAQTQSWENLKHAGAALYDRPAVELARLIANASNRVVLRSGGRTVEFGVAGSTKTVNEVLGKCKNAMLAE